MRRATRLLRALSGLALAACGSSGAATLDAGPRGDARVDAASTGRDAARFEAAVDARSEAHPVMDAAKDARIEARSLADAGRDAAHDAGGPPPDATAHDAHHEDVSTRDAQRDASGLCHAAPQAPDAARKVVLSHPFDSAMNPSSDFEVFDLDGAGAITATGVHFSLGATSAGEIAFTPDGAIGIVAEDDGTLGVFLFDAAGAPHVVSASLAGSYYATGVVMDPSGARAYVLDDQTSNNGGGIYTVSIACDGTLTDDGLLASAELPETLVPLGGGRAVVAAKSVLGAPQILDGGPDADASFDAGRAVTANDAVLVPWPSASSVLSWANPFGDDLAIVSAAALTQDGRYVLLGDNSQFSGIPNRVGVVRVTAGGIAGAGVVENVNDPESILASPFDDTLLVTSAFGNALFVLASGPDADAAPFDFVGPLTYTGTPPALPGPAVMVSRGSLEGRVLVAENLAIRQVQFAPHAVVTDLGPTPAGDPNALTTITGAIGVQP